MSSYFNLAAYYDILTSNISYSDRCKYFDGIIRRYGGKSKGVLLDLGCGTGTLCEEFSKCGYDVIGLDASVEMLSVASSKKQNDILYICQDMRDISLYNNVDIVVCALDGINHLLTENDVKKCFDSVYENINDEGLFIFDVNTIYKHQNIMANNSFVYDFDNIYCVWSSTFCEDNIVNIDIDLFSGDGKLYSRSGESFSERAYNIEVLDELLKNAGFTVLNHYDWDSDSKPHEKSEKIIFIAKKER